MESRWLGAERLSRPARAEIEVNGGGNSCNPLLTAEPIKSPKPSVRSTCKPEALAEAGAGFSNSLTKQLRLYPPGQHCEELLSAKNYG